MRYTIHTYEMFSMFHVKLHVCLENNESNLTYYIQEAVRVYIMYKYILHSIQTYIRFGVTVVCCSLCTHALIYIQQSSKYTICEKKLFFCLFFSSYTSVSIYCVSVYIRRQTLMVSIYQSNGAKK